MKRIITLTVGVLAIAALALTPGIASARHHHHHGRHHHHVRVKGLSSNGTLGTANCSNPSPMARKADDGSGDGNQSSDDRGEQSGASGPTGPQGATNGDDQGEHQTAGDDDANENQGEDNDADEAGQGTTGASGATGPCSD